MRRRELFLAAFAAPLLKGQVRSPEANSRVLEAVWEGVRDHFYDPRTRGVDWAAVRDEFLPKARACESDDQLLALLREMLSRLHNSHVFLYSREEWDWRGNILPFHMEIEANRTSVRYVLRKDLRPLADLEPGDQIVTVDGVPGARIRPLTLARLEPAKGNPNFGPAGSVAKVELRRGGRRMTVEAPRVTRPGGFDPVVFEHPRPGVAHLRFFTLTSSELPADKLGPLWEEAARSQALILDFRNCVGGDGKVSGFIASSLLGPGKPLFEATSRRGGAQKPVRAQTDSHGPRFDGRLAIIVNSNTESEPEILTAISRSTGEEGFSASAPRERSTATRSRSICQNISRALPFPTRPISRRTGSTMKGAAWRRTSRSGSPRPKPRKIATRRFRRRSDTRNCRRPPRGLTSPRVDYALIPSGHEQGCLRGEACGD
jgi:C-terminal processing protease CtpA/Prc